MIKCPNCNHDVSEENIFCPDCGARLMTAEAEQEPQETVVLEETVAPAAPAEEPAKAEKASPLAPVLSALKSFLAKAKEIGGKILDKIPLPRKIVGIIGAGIAAVLVLVIVLAVVLSGGKDPEYALYVKDGDLFFSNLKKDKEVEIMDLNSELGNSVAASAGRASALNESGSRLFYPEIKLDGVTLYYRDLNKKEGVKVDSNVSCYAINAKGTSVIYIKEGNLYKSNLKDKEKIASDVSSFRISEDFKKLLYTNKEGDIYFKNGNKDAEKLASEANLMSYDPEKLAWFFYSKEGSLYFQKTNGADKVKVDDEYSDFSATLEGGKAYYTKATAHTSKLWDHVEDDLAASDAAMVEPVAPEWPTRENYPTRPSRPYQYEYGYDDAGTAAYEAALEQYNKDYAAYEAERDRIDAAYQAAKDKYYEDQDAYYDARDLWWEKESRDSLRESLQEQDYEYSTYELYYFNGKESKLVASNLQYSHSFYDVTDKAAGYVKIIARGEVGKIKMSEVKYTSDVYSKLNEAENGDVTLKAVWEDKCFDFANDDISSLRFSEDAKTIYFLADVDEEKNVGELYKAKFSAKGVGEAKKMDDDVSASGFSYVEDAGICYLKDYKEGKGDLYVNGKEIDFDVSGGVIAFKGGYLYESDGDLKYFKGNKKSTVAEDVRSAVLLNEDKLVLLYDYDTEKGEGTMGLYKGGKLTELEDEVAYLIQPSDSMLHYISY